MTTSDHELRTGCPAYDFIVIGAGIAGRTLAVKLAQSGRTVLALEPLEEGDPQAESVPGFGGMTEGMLLCPPNHFWNDLHRLTDDPEWSAENARRRFERIECIENRSMARALRRLINPARRGFDGWLPTRALGSGLRTDGNRYFGPADPNDWSQVDAWREAAWCRPSAHDVDVAEIVRLRLLDTARSPGSTLTLRRGVRVTRLLCDESPGTGAGLRITGVQYLEPAADGPSILRRAQAGREVILCNGVFEAPRLLLFSGIGPAAVLARHGIPLLLDRPGVGAGFSACPEIAIETDEPGWFAPFRDGGVDGTMLVTLHSGRPEYARPDVVLYRRPLGGPAMREPTWRWTIRAQPSALAGHCWRRKPDGVGVMSALPHCPLTDTEEEALLDAALFLRRILAGAGVPESASRIVAPTEVIDLLSHEVALASFIRRHTRRATPVGTCPLGRANDPGAVLDHRLRVIGTENLRVVDEAGFPTPPGFFPDVPLLIAAELAADDLLRKASADDTVQPLTPRRAARPVRDSDGVHPAGVPAVAAFLGAIAAVGRRWLAAR